MSFADPERLVWLLIVPLLAAIAAVERRRLARDWAALGRSGMPPSRPGPAWWLAVGLIVVALARPRWGRAPAPPLPPGIDVVVAVDVSLSMGVEDAVPDRLSVAVEAARSVVAGLRDANGAGGSRAALVAFAGRAALRLPLTEHLDAVADALADLRPGVITPGGTDLGAGLAAALDAFDDLDHAGGRAVVLVSDGEDHEQTWPAAVAALREAGIPVFAVAIGDDQQAHPVPDPARGEPLAYRGETAVSRRDDTALRAIAEGTMGALLPVGLTAPHLADVFRDRLAPLAAVRREAVRPPERVERLGLFAAAAMAAIVWACRPYRRRPSLAWVLATLAVGLTGARLAPQAAETATPAEAVAAGCRAFADGRWPEALAAFERAGALAPDSPIPRYNLGTTLARVGRFAEAEARLREARERTRPSDLLRLKTDLALGNVALARGSLAEAIAAYDACLASTARGQQADALRHDAAINRAFAQAQMLPPPALSSGDAGPKSSRRSNTQPADENAGPRELVPDATGGDASRATTRPPESAPEASADASPEDRLRRALDRAREARSRRLSDLPPPITRGDRKPW